MWRGLHGWAGVLFAPLLLALALSGVVLAWLPLSTVPPAQMSLATLLMRIEAANPGLEIDRLERDPMGQITLRHYGGGSLTNDRVDPVTGSLMPKPKPGEIRSFAQSLHREFFLGREGRIVSGVLGGVMAMICVTGLRLAFRRAGGWRALLAPASGGGVGRWHVTAAQMSLLPLAIMALTAIWMSLATFEIIPLDLPRLRDLPESEKADTWPPASDLVGLDLPLSQVGMVTFPILGDWFDVYILQTHAVRAVIDQSTGAELARYPLPLIYRINRWMYRLHSGEGLRLWAGVLGLSALAVPVFATTGALIFVRRQSRDARGPRAAPTMIYVGSENGSTWAFARALGDALKAAGQVTGLTDLNRLGNLGPETHTALILTATYGDGAAPANGQRAQVAQYRAKPVRYAVLGFGDRQFPAFCAHAERMDQAMVQAGHTPLLPLERIHQQSGQTFATWARDLGQELELPLEPKPARYRLRSIGTTVQEVCHFEGRAAITTLLRLTPDRRLRYKTGDLVAVQPEDADVPRLYSIASASQSATLDLLVREHEGGKCSPMLCKLVAGNRLDVALRRHPFRLPAKGPVIMVAVGTGIAPFIGMAQEAPRHDLTLFWGMRYDPQDYPFRAELARFPGHFRPAFSSQHIRVTDLIRRDADHLRQRLLDQAGSVMICGSVAAATDIRAALSDILSGSGTTPEVLKRKKRLLEDVY